MKKNEIIVLLTIGCILIILGLIVQCSSNQYHTMNKENSIICVDTDAEIVSIVEKRSNFFGRTTSRSIVKDTHGHIGSVYGTWGNLGDIIEVQCTNGIIRIH